MAGEIDIARAEITVTLNDREAMSALDRTRAAVAREMAEIDRMEGKAQVDANVKPLERSLDRAKARLRELEGARAEATVELDQKRLDAEIAEAKRKIKSIDGRKATVEIDVAGQRRLAEADRQAAQFENKRAAAQEKLARAEEAEAARRERAARADLATQAQAMRMDERRTRDRESALRAEAKLQGEAARIDAARDAARERSLRDEAVMQSRAIALDTKRDADRMAAIQAEGRMQSQALRMDEQRTGRIRTEAQRARADLLRAYQDFSKADQQLDRLGTRRPVSREGRVRFEISKASALELRAKASAVIRAAGHDLPPLRARLDMRQPFRSLDLGREKVLGFIDALGNFNKVRLSIGPFTGTIKGFAIALSFLSPILTNLVAGVGALAGGIGSGLVGAAALGGAAVAGMGLALGSVLYTVKPMVQEFKNGTAAVAKWTKAVEQHGKGSKQAVEAQKQMNSVLKNMDPTMATAIKSMARFRDEWTKAVTNKAARPAIGDMMKQATQTLQSNFHTLSHGASETFKNLDAGWAGWMKGLRSPEGKRVISDLFSNFNQSMRPAMAGLGQIGAYFGRFAAAASQYMPGIAHTFKDWATHLNSVSDSAIFDKMRGMVTAAKSLGRLLMTAGRALKDFFSAGSGSGVQFMDDMTNHIQKWIDTMHSAEGRAGLQRFFDHGRTGAEGLFNALAPLGRIFVSLSDAISPLTTGLLVGIGWVGKIIAGLAHIAGMKGAFAAMGFVIATTFAVGKIAPFLTVMGRIVAFAATFAKTVKGAGIAGAFSKAVGSWKSFGAGGMTGGITAAANEGAAAMERAIVAGGTAAAAELRGAMATGGAAAGAEIGAAEAAGGAAAGAESAAGSAIGGGVAAAEGAGVAALGGEAAGAAGGLAAAEGAGAGLLSLLGPLGLAAGVAAAAFLILGGNTDHAANAMKRGMQNAADSQRILQRSVARTRSLMGQSTSSIQSLSDIMPALRSSTDALTAARRRQQKLEEQGIHSGPKYRAAVEAVAQAYNQNRRDLEQRTQAVKSAQQADTATARNLDQTVTRTHNKYASALHHEREVEDQLSRARDKAKNSMDPGFWREKIAKLTAQQAAADLAAMKASDNYTDAQRRRSQAANKLALDTINLQRVQHGLTATIPDSMAASVGKFARQLSSLPHGKQAFSLVMKLPDPGAIARVLALVNKIHDKKAAINIIANSKDAFEMLRGLNNILLHEKELKVNARVSEALKELARLNGVKLPPKLLHVLQQGGPQVIALLEKIIGRKLNQKEQKIVSTGGPGVIAMLDRIIGRHISDKAFNVIAHDQATSVISGVLGLLSQIPSVVHSLILTEHRTINTSGGPSSGHGNATGGEVTARQKRAMHVAQIADTKGPRSTKGGRYGSPTLLVGEENRTEYVIATNPSYHSANVHYLSQAARALGYDIEPAPAGRGGNHHKHKGPGDNPIPYKHHHKRPGKGWHLEGHHKNRSDGRWIPGDWLQTDSGAWVAPGSYRQGAPAYAPSTRGAHNAYTYGSVDPQLAQTIIGDYHHDSTHISSLIRQINKFHMPKHFIHSKTDPVTGKTFKHKQRFINPAWKDAQRRMRLLRADLKHTEEHRRRIQRRFNLSQADIQQQDTIEGFRKAAESAQNLMGAAESDDNISAWTTQRSKAITAWQNAIAKETDAWKHATGPYKQTIFEQLTGDQGTLAALNQQAFQPATGEGSLLGPAAQALLEKIQADVALEGVGQPDMFKKDWKGLLTNGQPETAGTALVDFWTNVLTMVQRANSDSNPRNNYSPGQIADAAQQLQAAQGALGTGDSTAAAGPTQGEIFSNERTALYQQYGSNAVAYAPPAAGGGRAPIYTGGGADADSLAAGGAAVAASAPAMVAAQSGADGITASAKMYQMAAPASRGADSGVSAGGHTIINNFPTPPPDPHSWTRNVQYEINNLL